MRLRRRLSWSRPNCRAGTGSRPSAFAETGECESHWASIRCGRQLPAPLEVGQLMRQLANTEYVGEVGLDFSIHGKNTKAAQLSVFDRLLAQPALRHKVVTVHSRGAEAVVIERLRSAGVAAILHWYTGPPGLIEEALAAGLYFSINPAMLRTEKGRKVIAAVPRHRALTESDGPFAKSHGHPTGPADMQDASLGVG